MKRAAVGLTVVAALAVAAPALASGPTDPGCPAARGPATGPVPAPGSTSTPTTAAGGPLDDLGASGQAALCPEPGDTNPIDDDAVEGGTHRAPSASGSPSAKSLEKLSSGFRINRAGDDAAGLLISGSLRSQVGGLGVARRDAQDGIAVVQTEEGALIEVHSALQRMRDLAVQAGDGTRSTEHTVTDVSVTAGDLSASESRIRDTDMAVEMATSTRSQVLRQAGTAVLAQAHSAPQGVLQLLRG